MSYMSDVRWLSQQEERAWRALQFMQMRLEVIADAAEAVLAQLDRESAGA